MLIYKSVLLYHVIAGPWSPFTILFIFHSSHLLCLFLIPGLIHVDKRFAEIKAQLERGEEVKGGLLTHLLVTKQMSLEEIYANATEMLLAGVDTVCVSICQCHC